jgi:ABC-2 type transport system ATP-binding protein
MRQIPSLSTRRERIGEGVLFTGNKGIVMDNIIVKVTNLTKKFGDFTAVDSVSFSVAKGEIYGFLGANGAGKTTTIKMLCGLIAPTSGEAEVAGYSVNSDPEEIKKRLGYMSQRFSLYGDLTVEENLAFYAGIYSMSGREIRPRMDEVVKLTALEEYRGRIVNTLPGGLKQRVALACSFIHRPEIIFLDEPTAGVDPVLRRRFWSIIDGFSASGITVFVTTHYMDEVEHCHRIALMDSGRIIREGAIRDIKATAFSSPVLEVDTSDAVNACKYLLEKKDFPGEVSLHGAMVHVIPSTGAESRARAEIAGILSLKNISVGGISEIEPSMEDVFVRLVRGHGNG